MFNRASGDIQLSLFPCWSLWTRAEAWEDVGEESWNYLGSFVPVPQGLVSDAGLFVPGKLYVVVTGSLFISWHHPALSLVESEVLVKMQKHTFYYYPQFFRSKTS
jgi:hypothetical protein